MIQSKVSTNSIPLTQAVYEAKKAEKIRLTKLRAEVVKRLQIARDMGDLSENGAYHAAKFELGNVGRQLRDINHLLANAYVPSVKKGTTAGFGSIVTLSNGKKKLTFMLVSQYESDPKENKLSLESPIGKAVFGKKAGDEVEVVTPSGKIVYQILEIK